MDPKTVIFSNALFFFYISPEGAVPNAQISVFLTRGPIRKVPTRETPGIFADFVVFLGVWHEDLMRMWRVLICSVVKSTARTGTNKDKHEPTSGPT